MLQWFSVSLNSVKVLLYLRKTLTIDHWRFGVESTELNIRNCDIYGEVKQLEKEQLVGKLTQIPGV